ncbi:hypothetical protein K227x_48630 [Rubripirellula lacrimiformis]|uniref:Chromosome partition protein Smc n=1 Tax=Rubripirellula lacrimiformis TaxID=1930273 RepID=A0A517NHC9_9BACT|nr:hypothetical protein [Rubripirellula lacrimiformis]QDT06453.1 hypothetical protein K227x_48630 [Rubripirellula lacrimiformis]
MIRCFLVLLLAFAAATTGLADESPLSQRQSTVAQRYQRLEELLLRLAEVETAENPERAALLRRAARQSRDKFVLERLRNASKSLESQEFQKAVDEQSAATEELASLLKLLLSEDRSKRIRDEKERVQKLVKELKRNLNNQRSTRARTENGADIQAVEKEQKSVTEKSEELKRQMEEDSEDPIETPAPSDSEPKDSEPNESKPSDSKPSDSEPSDSKPSDSKPSDSKPSDSKPSDSKPSDSKPSDSKPSDSKPSDSKPSDSKPSDSKPSDSKPSDSKPSESKPSDEASPEPPPERPQSPEQEAQKQLDQAIEKMKQAEKDLEEAKREEATEKQRQAEENLRAAIDQLEQILRQLREEELQRELAKLESRLRKMAAMQTQVLENTQTLAATPKSQRNRQTDLKAGDLAFEEKKITMEADRAMLLLREEGSSVAFPEVVLQIRGDTARVADFLAETKIDLVCQGIQEDILAALGEMIEALQKAQRDLEKKKQQQGQGKPGQSGQGEQPLVEALAELKLIRTMQSRIKSTTDRYSGLLESGESSGDEVLPLLQNLSERQSRLYRITRDLVLKRNQ